MSGLNAEDRVYAEDSDILTAAPCMWFAKCENDANGLRQGPIGNGEFGPIPICKRCDDRIDRLEGATGG